MNPLANEENLDRIRRMALDQMDKREQASWWLLGVGAFIELAGLIAYLVLMDFSDRLHWLILIAAILVYGTLTFGLRALGAQVKAYLLLVLRAIEETGKADPARWAGETASPEGPAGPTDG